MKKTYLSLFFVLACVVSLAAQRTPQTIVADVLAQMPADNRADYDKQMGDLLSAGEEGVLILSRMLHDPGQGSNAAVEYALSGLSGYVSAGGDENARLTVSRAYLKALEAADHLEKKAFIIRQLQTVGKDEAVDALGGCLNEESLCGPAARALASIGTERAAKALQTSLMRKMGTPRTQRDALLAIGEARLDVPEDLILGLAGFGDDDTQKAVFYALSRMGSKASLGTLGKAAEKAGFTMDKTDANEAYIILLKRVAGQGDGKEAEKAAADLLKKATKAGQVQTRTAALEILLSIRKEKGLKLVKDALKDPSAAYRNAALAYTSAFANKDIYIDLVKIMAKAKPEPRTDILHWLGREALSPEKNAILKNLDIRFDLPARQVLLDQLKSDNLPVKDAAVWALTRIGDPAVIPSIAALLTGTDASVVALARNALASFKGDIAPSVARILPQASDAGKIAALELLSLRKASANINTVLETIRSGSPEVQKAAYRALKDVVGEKDFTLLCGMLETVADKDAVAPLQQAVIASIASLPREEQVSTLSRRMIQAGQEKSYLYYHALAQTGDESALATLMNGYRQSSGDAREAAFNALLSWKGKEAADDLFDIVREGSSYSERALTGYMKLVSDPAITGENRLLGLRKAMEVAKTDEQRIQIIRSVGQTGTFPGLVYAGGFLDDKALQQTAAQAVMNIALNHPEYAGTNVKELLNKVAAVLDNPDADYQREAIRKYLNEAPAGEGFVSIFNGKDLTGWKGLVENPVKRAKMTAAQRVRAQQKADEQMRKDWKVEDGMLVFDGTGFDNLCTDRQYGDFEMYVDWKLDPAGPEADAGIYLRGTPQVQIWDIARVNVGAQVGSGGLYNNQAHESKPLKVADNPLGDWNTMYIKMIGDRVTVRLNGELVTDNVILENYWDRKQPIFPVEQLELQAHGSKVYYRNLYVKEIERPEPYQLSAEEKKEGYKILFDGTNMYEWTGNTVDYTLQDGTITLVPREGSGGNLYTKDEYADFTLRFEFQLGPAANNGLGIRTPLEGDAAYVGMELQILDNEHPVYKDLKPYQYHGSVYGVIPAKRGFLKPVGEWNYQEVQAKGDHIKVTLNGEVILDGNIREASQNGTATMDGLHHPGLLNKTGHIGFLGHGSQVRFRHIRIKELK